MLGGKTVTGMAKYIDREALVEWLKRIPLKDLSDGRGLCRVIFEDDFKKAIKKIPKGIIVDVAQVRHGRWVIDDNNTRECHCSECDWPAPRDAYGYHREQTGYCHVCGAKMDGGAD